MTGQVDDVPVTANALLDQYAAEVRARAAARPAATRAGIRKLGRRAAADIKSDLPGIDDATIGAVILRAAAFAHNLAAAQPGATAREVANLLDLAGERLYHHPGKTDTEQAH